MVAATTDSVFQDVFVIQVSFGAQPILEVQPCKIFNFVPHFGIPYPIPMEILYTGSWGKRFICIACPESFARVLHAPNIRPLLVLGNL